jgi:DNA-binding Lrp family transcriptional regulator
MQKTNPPLGGLAAVASQPRTAVPLDDVDLRLLRLLALDARTSQRQLAAQLEISPPTVGERMNRLERAGVIRGYSVDVDWEALGVGVLVYLSVTAEPGYSVADLMRSLYAITEVDEVTVVTGSLDLLARLRVRDHIHLRDLLINQLWQTPGLQGTETMTGMAQMPPKDFLATMLARMRDKASGAAADPPSAAL